MTFENTLIRCSSLGCLFTEPRDKKAKEAGELSQTAKTHLVEVYARELWGVEKQVQTKQMQKGTEAEDDAILLKSRLDGVLYEKNQIRESNEWITGHADIVEPDFICDTKCSWDAFSFLPKLIENVDKDYELQLQGYMWLYNRPKAVVSYCLVSTPQNIVEGEKYRLLRSMDVVSEESPEFLRAWEKQKSAYYFDHIPIHLRIINHFVERNQEIIDQIPAKVAKAREFLAQLHERHINHNKLELV